MRIKYIFIVKNTSGRACLHQDFCWKILKSTFHVGNRVRYRTKDKNLESEKPERFFPRLYKFMELLHSHITTLAHWSSGLTVCFPPQGATVRALGVPPTLWNWDLLLALSCYSGDPDVIPDHQLR